MGWAGEIGFSEACDGNDAMSARYLGEVALRSQAALREDFASLVLCKCASTSSSPNPICPLM